VLLRQTFAGREDSPRLEIVDIRHAQRILGRAHVIHHRDTGTSAIEELFVRPGARREGRGSMLEAITRELAERKGKTRLELWLHEADAGTTHRHAAKAFGTSLGYEWAHSIRPELAAVAVKLLA
jgi:GNAT superfamily N-acetyltransferase